MRIDGNAMSGKAIYSPTNRSGVDMPKPLPSAMEAPMQVADNILSRRSHFRHEGQRSEYDQVRELHDRVMTPAAKANLYANTATKFVSYFFRFVANCPIVNGALN